MSNASSLSDVADPVYRMCVGGVLAMGDGFPDNLAIIGDEFLKSCEYRSRMCSMNTTDICSGYSIYDYSNGARVGLAASINNK